MAAESDFNVVQTSAEANVSSIRDQMNSFVDVLLQYATQDLTFGGFFTTAPWVDPDTAGSAANAIVALAPGEPTFSSFTGTDPGSANVGTITVPTLDAAPSAAFTRPDINLPTAPDATLPDEPGNAPTINPVTLPPARNVTLPPTPSLANIDIPDAPPAAIIPPYDSYTVDDSDIFTPTNDFSYNEGPYNSDLLNELRAKLEGDLLNGGYGIEPLDELALWERARERELLNTELAVQEASRQAAARGFMMPPGALNAMINKAEQAALEKNSSLSRDVALKRADLYVENRKFIIDQVRHEEDMSWKYWSFAQERALNAAKYSVEFSISIYNARVAKYNADVGRMNVNATVYAAKLRAAMAHIEEYKTRVEALGVAANIQKNVVELYSVQVNAALATIQLYKAELEAAQISAELEKMKMDLFKTRVDAYVAQVGAKSAEFQMFRAQIDGEKAKVDIYSAEVQAYAEQVRAYTAKAQASEVVTRAQIAVTQANTDIFKAKIDKYRADVEKYGALIRAEVEKSGVRIKTYEIKADSMIKAAQLSVDAQKANANVAIAAAQTESSYVLGQAQALVAHANMASGAATAGLKVFGDIGAAYASAASGIAAQIKAE